VLEPERPTLSDTARRIALGGHCSASFSLDPERPRVQPRNMCFMGPDAATAPLQLRMHAHGASWDAGRCRAAGLAVLFSRSRCMPALRLCCIFLLKWLVWSLQDCLVRQGVCKVDRTLFFCSVTSPALCAAGRMPRENLEQLLELKLPTRATSVFEDISADCCICYAYRLPAAETRSGTVTAGKHFLSIAPMLWKYDMMLISHVEPPSAGIAGTRFRNTCERIRKCRQHIVYTMCSTWQKAMLRLLGKYRVFLKQTFDMNASVGGWPSRTCMLWLCHTAITRRSSHAQGQA
jgi:hypothetical protein